MKFKFLQQFKLALQKSRPISISLSPNVQKDDVLLALNLLIRPWKWKKGKEIKLLEEEFAKFIGVKYAVSFNSGRSALYAILKALDQVQGLDAGSDVLLQAFTCNAVPNPVLWAGLNPIYVDCNKENFNIDTEDLKAKITQQSKAIIVQHTFGIPANMDEITKICQEHKLILIEDCAHSLGAKFNGKIVGSFGDVGFFSFSRDKVISSIYGGMVVTNNEELADNLRKFQNNYGHPNKLWVFQQLLHPVLLQYIILPVYNFFNLGKALLIIAQITHILSKAVSWKEKQGKIPNYFPRALPNAMAILALNQFAKLDKFYSHRNKVTNYYKDNLKDTKFIFPDIGLNSQPSFLRFTVKHPKAHEIIWQAWHKENILLGDWYTTPIAPFDTNLEELKYKPGSCIFAERLAKETLNLPTHINITEDDCKKIIEFLKKFK